MDFREAEIRRAEAALARLGRLGGRAGWAIHAVPQPEYGQARGESRCRLTQVEIDDNWCVIRGFLPTAGLAQDAGTLKRLFQGWCDPDMVKAPAFICRIPIASTIAPPAIERLFRRNELADRINPIVALLHSVEFFHLNRRVANDL